MPRGIAHSPELRAEVVAAVLAGATLAVVAKRYGLAKRTVANWVGTVGTEQRARETELELGELILGLITEHITTLRAELQATTRPNWLEKQSAAELAQLVVAQRDTLLRLLAGLRPAEPERGLSEPAEPAGPTPGAGADDR
jgi:transposase-like protein